ncbi:haloacid dehalogenase type II [Mesorhizobium sp. BAC0120]|uniref:haloacid dehalogenase type II n=1 Tax=Mesorhizobium sp. BAC0120 TaxID=3090670 RepID=UPI00298CF8DB|nr:haloacid dehalogenase type II [Mesorhizobium sp. BAC0120]MDW6021050.1 haloacid dehalogenase type II [Mesorhizobium sp. BAC0120]
MPHSVYAFDAYGTLFDVHSAVASHSSRVGPDAEHFSELWRTKQLEYSWIRTLMPGAYRDFWKLTEDALDFAFAKFPSVDRSLRPDLLQAYRTLKAYPEVQAVLAALKSQDSRVAILSNGSPEMLKAAVASAGLDLLVDRIFSVDAVRAYKTHPDAYRLLIDIWGIQPGEISFQSSNRWDIAGAARFGFYTVWVNRSSQPDEYPDSPPDRVVVSLAKLIDPN